jgi:hypothetical protein
MQTRVYRFLRLQTNPVILLFPILFQLYYSQSDLQSISSTHATLFSKGNLIRLIKYNQTQQNNLFLFIN